MANEKQTDSINWKDRLSDLDHIAGEPVDKNAAWERLQNRLHDKPARSIVPWYWAAAGLILLMIIPFVMGKRLGKSTEAQVVRQKNTPVKSLPAVKAVPQTEAEPVLISTVPVITSSNQPVAVSPVRKKRLQSTKSLPLVVDNPATQGRLQIIPIVPPADTAVLLITGAPVKKKLQVVHINELGKQEQENAKFATHTDASSLPGKWLTQENYRANTLPPGTADRDLLKIKIPLKN